jgi:hypothetical protein
MVERVYSKKQLPTLEHIWRTTAYSRVLYTCSKKDRVRLRPNYKKAEKLNIWTLLLVSNFRFIILIILYA